MQPNVDGEPEHTTADQFYGAAHADMDVDHGALLDDAAQAEEGLEDDVVLSGFASTPSQSCSVQPGGDADDTQDGRPACHAVAADPTMAWPVFCGSEAAA